MIAYLKAGIALAALAAAFAGGSHLATIKGDRALLKAEAEFATERVDFGTERTAWADERALISLASAKALAAQASEAAAKEEALRKANRSSENAYLKRIKELEDVRTKVDGIIADTSPTGGLWANVEEATCTASTATSAGQPGADLRKALGGANRPSGTLRCRLTEPDAKALVQISEVSDKRTELLNKCIRVLNDQTEILAPISVPTVTKP